MKIHPLCPFCDGPTRPDPDAPNVFLCDSQVCMDGGPVIYNRVIIRDCWPDPDEARFESIEAALEDAAPHLARLIGLIEIEGRDQAA